MATMADKAVLVDTNVLLMATARQRRLYRAAIEVVDTWPNLKVRLLTCGQILREYLVVATRPVDVNGLGLDPSAALENVAAFAARMRFLDEGRKVAQRLEVLVRDFDCRGKQIHDANLIAVALVHQANAVVTANPADFRRFASQVEILDLAAI
jgi:predicted nucleic acid-binding protein